MIGRELARDHYGVGLRARQAFGRRGGGGITVDRFAKNRDLPILVDVLRVKTLDVNFPFVVTTGFTTVLKVTLFPSSSASLRWVFASSALSSLILLRILSISAFFSGLTAFVVLTSSSRWTTTFLASVPPRLPSPATTPLNAPF